MQVNLHGKTALITGASKGIGLGLAKALDTAGAKTIIVSLETPAEVQPRFVNFTTAPEYFQADLSDPENHAKLVTALNRNNLAVDILVNNAGIQFTSPTQDFPFAKWQQIIAINLSAVFYLSSLLLPGMQERQFGRIINISSVHGLVASINKAAYVAAKHGIVGLTKVIALENANKGITCNALCPGFVHTDLCEEQIVAHCQSMKITRQEAIDAMLDEKHPSRQFVTIEQIGALAVFVASDAAAQITGTTLPIDGGWTAR